MKSLLYWWLHHAQNFVSSLGTLTRNPLATLTTAAVLGIALAMPTGLQILASDLEKVGGNWQGNSSLSVFFKTGIPEKQTELFAEKIRQRDGIYKAQLISADEALVEFQQLSGFDEALNLLPENPLPAVLLVQPDQTLNQQQDIENLITEIETEPMIELVQLDMEWLQRLSAITHFIHRGVIVLGILLGIGVILIIGNTIRLEIQNRHDEIRICKLIGATDAFIRRPFLYTGAWYGLFGGIIAWWMVTVSLLLIQEPLEQLAGLYEYSTQFSALSFIEVIALLVISTTLGLSGSWLAVHQNLKQIQPDRD